MKTAAIAAAILVMLGALLVPFWLTTERPAPGKPVEPLPMAYVIDERPASSIAEPTPTSALTVAVPTSTQEPTATLSPTPTPTMVRPTPTRTAVAPKPLPTATVEEKPTIVEPPVLAPTPSPSSVVPPRGVYPSPGIGSPEAVEMEEKTLGYLNWARVRQNIPSYKMNPEMQALAREQALLYVQTRESTGQYPTADRIAAATKARGWFFEDGGGPAPFELLPYSFEEIAADADGNMAYAPYYRNPAGTEMGIGFAFYSGKGRFGQAGRTVRVVVWDGKWDR